MGLLHLYTPLLLPNSAFAPRSTPFLSGQAIQALDFIKCHHPIGKNSNSVDGCGASAAGTALNLRNGFIFISLAMFANCWNFELSASQLWGAFLVCFLVFQLGGCSLLTYLQSK